MESLVQSCMFLVVVYVPFEYWKICLELKGTIRICLVFKHFKQNGGPGELSVPVSILGLL